jgi:hypothetical protein
MRRRRTRKEYRMMTRMMRTKEVNHRNVYSNPTTKVEYPRYYYYSDPDPWM